MAHAERQIIDREPETRTTKNTNTASTPAAKTTGKELSVMEERFCHANFANTLSVFEYIAGKWFRKENPEHNIPLAFDALLVSHNAQFQAIETFAKRALPEKIETAAVLRNELTKLNIEFGAFLDKNRAMVSADHEFLEKLAPAEASLAQSEKLLSSELKGCSEDIQQKWTELKKVQQDMKNHVANLKSYVAASTKKREAALNVIKMSQSVALETKLSQTLTTSLIEVQRDIGRIFFAGDLKMEIAHWSNFQGEISPCTKMLSFDSCVAAIESGIVLGQKLKAKIERTELFGNSKEALIKEINNHIALASARRAKHLSAGWLDFYTRREKNVVDGILAYPQYWSENCLVAAKQYARALVKKPTEQNSRDSEKPYSTVARLCLFGAESSGGQP